MTGILATVGSALCTKEQLIEAYKIGVKAFRINLGKVNRDNIVLYKNLIELKKIHNEIKILLDLPSSRPRVTGNSNYPLNSVRFVSNQQVIFIDSKKYLGEENYVPVSDLNELLDLVNKCLGIIEIADGRAFFFINSVNIVERKIITTCIKCRMEIQNDMSINFQNMKNVNYKHLRAYDVNFLQEIINYEFPEFISISFVNNCKDVMNVTNYLKSKKIKYKKIIAKLETDAAVSNMSEIIQCCDGIMLGRGDLLNSILPENLPNIQKNVLELCNIKEKISIVATQVFERFAFRGEICSAELSDVALAVSQKADYIMLSGESAVGLNSKETMDLIQKQIMYETKNFNCNLIKGCDDEYFGNL